MAFKLQGMFSMSGQGINQIKGIGPAMRGAAQSTSAATGLMTRGMDGFIHSGLGAIKTINGIKGAAANARGAIQSGLGMLFNLPNALATGGLALVGKSIVDAVGYKEQQLIGLQTMLKSGALAAKTYGWALKFASDTPFETPDVIQSTKGLLSYGFSLRQIPTLMRAIGDTSSGLSLGAEGMTRIVGVFGQIKAKGRLQGEEMMQLTNAGIPVRQWLEKSYGLVGKGFDKLLSSGAISANDALGIITQGMAGKFGGMMNAQSRSIFGLMSNLKSRPFEMFQSLSADKELKPFKTLLQNLSSMTDFDRNPIGKKIKSRFVSGIGGLFKSSFGILASSSDPKKIAVFVGGIFSKLDKFGAWLKKEGPGLMVAGKELFMGVLDGVRLLGGTMGTLRAAGNALGKLTGAVQGAGGNGLARFAGSFLVVGGALRIVSPLFSTAWSILRGGFGLLRGGLGLIIRFGPVLLGLGRTVLMFGLTMARGLLIGMGPIGWVVLGISLIGGALVLAYNKFGWFRNGVNAAWTSIKNTGIAAWEGLKAYMMGVVNWFGGMGEKMRGIGSNIWQGLTGGIAAGVGAVKNAAMNLGNAAKVGVSSSLLIKSPSRIMHYQGLMTGAGLVGGMNAKRSAVLSAARKMAAAAIVGTSLGAPSMAAASAGLGARGGSAGITVHVTFGDIVVGDGGTRGSGATIKSEVGQAVKDALLEAFEQLGLQTGTIGGN